MNSQNLANIYRKNVNFRGVVTADTAAPSTNSEQVATTEYVQNEIKNFIEFVASNQTIFNTTQWNVNDQGLFYINRVTKNNMYEHLYTYNFIPVAAGTVVQSGKIYYTKDITGSYIISSIAVGSTIPSSPTYYEVDTTTLLNFEDQCTVERLEEGQDLWTITSPIRFAGEFRTLGRRLLPKFKFNILSAGGRTCEFAGILENPNNTTNIEIPAVTTLIDSEGRSHTYDVVAVGANALTGAGNITTIKIPYGITEIKDFAFSNCGIEYINLPSSLRKIGNYAFSGSNLIKVTIPNSVESVGTGAFKNCSLLQEVTFPDNFSCLTVNPQMFQFCHKLTKVNLPSQTTISNEAFFFIGIGDATSYSRDLVIDAPELEVIQQSFQQIVRNSLTLRVGRDFGVRGGSTQTIFSDSFRDNTIKNGIIWEIAPNNPYVEVDSYGFLMMIKKTKEVIFLTNTMEPYIPVYKEITSLNGGLNTEDNVAELIFEDRYPFVQTTDTVMNPKKLYFEEFPVYFKTRDTTPISGKTYYTKKYTPVTEDMTPLGHYFDSKNNYKLDRYQHPDCKYSYMEQGRFCTISYVVATVSSGFQSNVDYYEKIPKSFHKPTPDQSFKPGKIYYEETDTETPISGTARGNMLCMRYPSVYGSRLTLFIPRFVYTDSQFLSDVSYLPISPDLQSMKYPAYRYQNLQGIGIFAMYAAHCSPKNKQLFMKNGILHSRIKYFDNGDSNPDHINPTFLKVKNVNGANVTVTERDGSEPLKDDYGNDISNVASIVMRVTVYSLSKKFVSNIHFTRIYTAENAIAIGTYATYNTGAGFTCELYLGKYVKFSAMTNEAMPMNYVVHPENPYMYSHDSCVYVRCTDKESTIGKERGNGYGDFDSLLLFPSRISRCGHYYGFIPNICMRYGDPENNYYNFSVLTNAGNSTSTYLNEVIFGGYGVSNSDLSSTIKYLDGTSEKKVLVRTLDTSFKPGKKYFKKLCKLTPSNDSTLRHDVNDYYVLRPYTKSFYDYPFVRLFTAQGDGSYILSEDKTLQPNKSYFFHTTPNHPDRQSGVTYYTAEIYFQEIDTSTGSISNYPELYQLPAVSTRDVKSQKSPVYGGRRFAYGEEYLLTACKYRVPAVVFDKYNLVYNGNTTVANSHFPAGLTIASFLFPKCEGTYSDVLNNSNVWQRSYFTESAIGIIHHLLRAHPMLSDNVSNPDMATYSNCNRRDYFTRGNNSGIRMMYIVGSTIYKESWSYDAKVIDYSAIKSYNGAFTISKKYYPLFMYPLEDSKGVGSIPETERRYAFQKQKVGAQYVNIFDSAFTRFTNARYLILPRAVYCGADMFRVENKFKRIVLTTKPRPVSDSDNPDNFYPSDPYGDDDFLSKGNFITPATTEELWFYDHTYNDDGSIKHRSLTADWVEQYSTSINTELYRMTDYPTKTSFPEKGKLYHVYIDTSEDKKYQWDSSTNTYIEVYFDDNAW